MSTLVTRPATITDGDAAVDVVEDAVEQAGPAPVSTEVVLAAALLVVAVAPILAVVPHDRVVLDTTLPVLAWLPLGVAGVVALDLDRGSLLGRVCVAGALTPSVLVGLAALGLGGASGEAVGARLAGVLAVAGPLTVSPLVAVALAVRSSIPARSGRRWSAWVGAVAVATVVGTAVAWSLEAPAALGVVAAVGEVVVAVLVVLAALGRPARPVDEPLLDGVLLTGVVLLAAVVGAGVRWFARSQVIFGSDVLGVLAAAAALAALAPGALWIRAELLRRRYGSGELTALDLATLTAGSAAEDDVRQLLARAGALVLATSGVRECRVVLDQAPPEPGWEARTLAVGGQPVGTLLLRAAHPDGLEVRQERALAKVLPTLALAARAVALAVEADHARADVARQREVERARILADLHDDLGPALAGMSMRVAAARASAPGAALDALAAYLARARADLRRVVAGLTPSALSDGDLASALAALVGSFASPGGPRVSLHGQLPEGLPDDVATVVYRTVAEGCTNAVRHAAARRIEVVVSHRAEGVEVLVEDDGRGGPAVPGVGLSSLEARAAALGGTLALEAAAAGGTRLRVCLPTGSAGGARS